MVQNFTEFYFFNNVGKLDQENFSKYMEPFFPDGVLKGVGQELQVYANSTGMKVMIKPGICYVHTHRGANPVAEIELAIEPADPTYGRIDLVVARAVYDIAPNSYMALAIKKGTPSASPAPPIVEKTAGVTWEIPLAQVFISAGVQTISSAAVTDKRIWSVLPIERGGTDAMEASTALENIFEGGVLPLEKGGTGVSTTAAIRQLLELKNAAQMTVGSATVYYPSIGIPASVAVPGLPAGGLVFIEPAQNSRNSFYAADVRYFSHTAGQLTLNSTTTVSGVTVVVGWIG